MWREGGSWGGVGKAAVVEWMGERASDGRGSGLWLLRGGDGQSCIAMQPDTKENAAGCSLVGTG